MNSKLTANQMTTICQDLGRVKLKLLFKATIHGYDTVAFHQRCDNQGPTVSVGYNNSGYVFGGYTNASFNRTGAYLNDPKAFLFTFSGGKLVKYPTTNSANAVYAYATTGPYFGNALVLMNGNQPVVHSNPGQYYNFNAAEMHGNNLQLIECEVYQVEESTETTKTTELEKPWRPMVWESQRRQELMDCIRTYCPLSSSVSQVRVLLVGPVGAGKSSFFNSINSVFRGHVTGQAITGCSSTSLTTQYRTYSVKDGREGKHLPISLCDTMGLEESSGAGLDIDDIIAILKGHVIDFYQFNPTVPVHSESLGYRTSPELRDRIHCVVYVTDSCKISIMSEKLEAKLNAIRKKVNLLGIPQLVLFTKVDEACPLVKDDLRNVYKSGYIKDLMHEASARVGVPVSCVVPVKNYCEEIDLDLNMDIMLLSALLQMLRYADNYFDDISDRQGKLTLTRPKGKM